MIKGANFHICLLHVRGMGSLSMDRWTRSGLKLNMLHCRNSTTGPNPRAGLVLPMLALSTLEQIIMEKQNTYNAI
jgi:hypothetical protein